MHVPDGFIDPATSIGAGVVATCGLGVCLRRSNEVFEENRAPMVGLVAAFVFSVQMLNFPVASGTSGHVLGGVLAAVLIGPWAGAIAVASVLVVQALLFADGGLTALGVNIVNMALVTALAGYALFSVLRRVLPRRASGLTAAAGIAAALSVVLASAAFTVEYAIGGTADIGLTNVARAMIGVHVLIGIGEGIITAMVVSAVLAARPDLVPGAEATRFERPTLEVLRAEGNGTR